MNSQTTFGKRQIHIWVLDINPGGPGNKKPKCASIGWIVTGLFDGLSDCVYFASERVNESFLSYELGLIARSAGHGLVASAFIDGVLHRETSNWNHK